MELSWALFSIRSLGWLGMLICGCVLAQIHFAPALVLPAGAGGIVGHWLAGVGSPLFGWIGLTLLCVTGVLTGAQAALPIFGRFLLAALGPDGGAEFEAPSELEAVEVHLASGRRAGWGCAGERELFLPATAPQEGCGERGGGGTSANSSHGVT